MIERSCSLGLILDLVSGSLMGFVSLCDENGAWTGALGIPQRANVIARWGSRRRLGPLMHGWQARRALPDKMAIREYCWNRGVLVRHREAHAVLGNLRLPSTRLILFFSVPMLLKEGLGKFVAYMKRIRRAYVRGKKTRELLSVSYEQFWSTPVPALISQLEIAPA